MENIPNNKEDMPLRHYGERLKSADLAEAAERIGARYAGGAVSFPFLGSVIAVTPDGESVSVTAEPGLNALTGNPAKILFMRLILDGAMSPRRGNFLAYREIPWGETYDAAFNGRVRLRLAGTFGKRPEVFAAACEKLGGTPAGVKDISYDLPLPALAHIRVILREGDDEFPASAQVLFSDNIVSLWSAEDLAVLGEVTIRALAETTNR